MARLPDRFTGKFTVDTTSGCWLWTAGRIGKGYGQYWDGTRMTLAHRYAYTVLVGPIPGGLQLDHRCRVRHCVNPRHLEPVTNRENTLRGTNHVAVRAAQTHCKHGHEFTPENTRICPNGTRACRPCSARDNREKRRRARLRPLASTA